ncbi:hypothetical protein SAMN05216332_10215 [Nitrosospira briensis]|nr:hypothetical protein SAMN05216332_10215 [Nitrosospira briensis]
MGALFFITRLPDIILDFPHNISLKQKLFLLMVFKCL